MSIYSPHLPPSRGGFSNISPPPTHEGGTIMPATSLHTCNFSLGRILVIISAPFRWVWIFSSCSILELIISRIYWYCTSMCLVQECKLEFLARWIAFWLSQYRLYFSCLRPNSCRKFFIHNTSLQASAAAIYLASVVDKEMHFCSLDCHDTAPPAMSPDTPMWTFLSPYLQHNMHLYSPAIQDHHFQSISTAWNYL